MSKKVFISYRREDSRYQARQIYDAFSRALPAGTVFMDVDSIPPGADFVSILEGWVNQCDILLALIGPEWINSVDPRTRLPRLNNPDDFVRIEIRGALARDIPVVPVLLDTAEMPLADQLPKDMKSLPRRHAQFVNFRTFDTDVAGLIAKLQINSSVVQERRIIADPEPTSASPSASPEPMRGRQREPRTRSLTIVAAGLALVALPIMAAITLTGIPQIFGNQPGDAAASAARLQAARADLEKSEKARQDAAARADDATSELAKARDALIKSEKGRQDAETQAGAAAAELSKTQAALSKSDMARRDAEAKANAAVAAQGKAQDALARSEKARQDAEQARQQAEAMAAEAVAQKAKAEEEARIVEARKKRITTPPGVAGSLLSTFDSNIWWVFNDTTNCEKVFERYSLEVSATSLTWRHRGTVTVESIDSNKADEIRTTTQSSTSAGSGQRWIYSRSGNAIQMQAGGGQGKASILFQCP